MPIWDQPHDGLRRRVGMLGLFAAMAALGVPSSRTWTEAAPATSSSPPVWEPPTTSAPSTQPDEDSVEALLELARNATKVGDDAKAIAYYQRILAPTMQPRNLDALAGLARLYQRMNNTTEALQYFVAAADAAFEANRMQTAEELLGMAGTIDPKHPQVLYQTARLYGATNRRVQSLVTFREYLKTSEGQADYRAHREIGAVYFRERYHRQAIRSLEEANRLNPSDGYTLNLLAQVYREMRDSAKAEEYAGRAVQATPDNLDFRETYGSILIENRKADDAARVLRSSLELAMRQIQATPGRPDILDSALRVCRSYRSALLAQVAANPTGITEIPLAETLEREADIGHLIALNENVGPLRDAARAAPENVAILRELATMLFKAGRRADAEQTCQQILKVKPDDEFATRLLAQMVPTTRPATSPAAR